MPVEVTYADTLSATQRRLHSFMTVARSLIGRMYHAELLESDVNDLPKNLGDVQYACHHIGVSCLRDVRAKNDDGYLVSARNSIRDSMRHEQLLVTGKQQSMPVIHRRGVWDVDALGLLYDYIEEHQISWMTHSEYVTIHGGIQEIVLWLSNNAVLYSIVDKLATDIYDIHGDDPRMTWFNVRMTLCLHIANMLQEALQDVTLQHEIPWEWQEPIVVAAARRRIADQDELEKLFHHVVAVC